MATTDNGNREREIFEAALDIAPAEGRLSYLKGACGKDAELLARVQSLLQAHETAGGFLPEQPKAAATVSIVTEKAGDKIGHYKLLQQIGEGGCGAVYMAEQEEPIRRRVALKVIKLGMDTKQVIARFEAERQALALMDHPNIAKVLDAGATETGRPYFVMELVRGIRITDYCDENNLSTEERLDLFVQICHAVQHAHQKGIIHRDIKPSNILVTAHDGKPLPKIIDFGIAKATSGQVLTDKTLFTAFEQFIGTPAYMSPEQAEMSTLDIDTRSDIYALGVLLYELLTGQTPFDAQALVAAGLNEMRRIIREQEPMRPSTRISTLEAADQTSVARRRHAEPPQLINMVRGDLDWIAMKCLEKDRTRRYETANGLASDILCYLNNEPVLARPPGRFYRFQKLVRRNKLAFAAGAVVSGVLVVGVIASTWQAVRATRARHEAVEARNHEQELREAAQQAQANEARMRERAEKEELEARQRAYASDMLMAKQALDANNLGLAQDLLDRQRPQPGQRDMRDWEWRYLWQQSRSEAMFTLCRESSEIESLAVSQDGQWLAIGQARGGLTVWDLRTRQQVFQLAEGGTVRAVFSPTGSLLAFSTLSTSTSGKLQAGLHLWNATTRQMTAELPLSSECLGLVFSGDGQTLATCTRGSNGQVTLWQMPEGKELVSYPATPFGYRVAATPFAATRDLQLAAYTLPAPKFRVVDLREGKELWAAEQGVPAVAFSPDGKILVSTGGYRASDIRLWDVVSGKEIGRLEGHGSYVISLVFWPDGKKLASSGADQTIRIWDVASRKCLDVLRGHRQEVWRLALLPDDKTLVSGCKDGTVCFWDTSVTHWKQPYITIPENVLNWRFAPDSRSVLTVSQHGQVSRWTGSDFQQKEALLEIGTNLYAPYFSRDGRSLAVGSTNGVLQIWDVSRRSLGRQWTNTTGLVKPLSFLSDDNKLITWSAVSNLLHEWNLTTGLELQTWWTSSSVFSGFCLSPDERSCMAIGHLGDVVFRNFVDESQTNVNLDVPYGVRASFSPDGKLLAVASEFGYARVWETATWREVATLRGVLPGVHSVAFSGDGKRLATGGGTGEALTLWDTDNWQEVLMLEGQGTGYAISFSPDGNAISTMNVTQNVDIWRAPSWEEIAAAEKTTSASGP
ncbi:MAG TPA: protein kinase [Candidatus Acidoferrum sp.]|nr:protein kinase [Candidatus Acidoferrum sp.]